MTAALFYVDAIPATGPVTVSGEEARHAVSVMRLAAGEEVLAGDGRGTLARCRVRVADRRAGLVLDAEELQHVPAARQLNVVQAVPKGERGDIAVELLTEAGASRIVPWLSRRTVADWRGKQEPKRRRWQRVARAAAKQSRRAWEPEVGELCTGTPTVGAGFVLHESARDCLYDLDLPAGELTVVVGPEGGLTDDELGALTADGARLVRLGPEILRSSTAGAAACLWIRGLEMRVGT